MCIFTEFRTRIQLIQYHLLYIKKPRAIPMLLLIGWRGSPKIKDEPQHKVKGLITKPFKLLDIKYIEISNDLKKLKILSIMLK